MESVAASILQRAVDMDQKAQYTMAFVLYQEGLQVLVNSIKALKDPERKKYFQSKAAQYMDRAERVKALIDEKKSLGEYKERTEIQVNATGYGYTTIFGRFLDSTVTQIRIEDPYIRLFYQCQNLVRFCELAVQKCQSLSKIILITGKCTDDSTGQQQRLDELKNSLSKRLVILEIQFSKTLHDRQIILSNGWIIKIGRGLNYFKPPDGKCILGSCDLELRPCLETVIDTFYQSDLQQQTSKQPEK